MPLVKGKIISSEPVSVSSASSILNKFNSSHSGITAEVFAFLKRSSAAIDELLILTNEGRNHHDHRHDAAELHQLDVVEEGKQLSVARNASNELFKKQYAEPKEPDRVEDHRDRETEDGNGRKHKKRKKAGDDAVSNADEKTVKQDGLDDTNQTIETEPRKKRKKHHQIHGDPGLNLSLNDVERKSNEEKHHKPKKEHDTYDQIQQNPTKQNAASDDQGIGGGKKHHHIHEGLAKNISPNVLEKDPSQKHKKKHVKMEHGSEQDAASDGPEQRSRDKRKKHK